MKKSKQSSEIIIKHVSIGPEHKEMEDQFVASITMYANLLGSLPAIGDRLRLDVDDDATAPGVQIPSEVSDRPPVFLEIIARTLAESNDTLHVLYDTNLVGLE